MKLASYIAHKGLSPEDFAQLVGDVSASGVIKWMREERVPRPDQLRRIFDVTNGEVSPNDFVLIARPTPKKDGRAA